MMVWFNRFVTLYRRGKNERKTSGSHQFSRKCFLENGLPQTYRPLQVGGHHRFQLLHHAQPPLHFYTAGKAAIPQDVAVVPELWDESERCTHATVEAVCHFAHRKCNRAKQCLVY